MPSLIVSSRYTTDSQLLRQVAQELGWETLRLDGPVIPEWFEPPDDQIALFYTAPHAFDLAAQLSRRLLGCPSDWTVRLPSEFLQRELRQCSLAEALALPGGAFVKHAVSKAFPAGVYHAAQLKEVAAHVPLTALVHVGEVVRWQVEYRCFIREGKVQTLSPYRRHGEIREDHTSSLGAPPQEFAAAAAFAECVMSSPEVTAPPAFVLDIGFIADRGWAVVEFNECWASGIYSCDPKLVLPTLLRACVPPSDDDRWDFQQHYSSACG